MKAIEILIALSIGLSALGGRRNSSQLLLGCAVLLSGIAWFSYQMLPVSLIGGACSAFILYRNYYSNDERRISSVFLPVAIVLATAPVTWTLGITSIVLALKLNSKSLVQKIILTPLALLSVLSLSQVVGIELISSISIPLIVVLIITSILSNNQTLPTILGITLYKLSVFGNTGIVYLGMLAILFLMLIELVRVWAEQRSHNVLLSSKRINILVVYLSGVLFGEVGFWSLLLALCALEVAFNRKEIEKDKILTSVPWIALSALFLIPVSPMFLFLMSGKGGAALGIGVIASFVVTLSCWRYLKLADIHSVQELDWHRLLSVVVFVGVIACGCYYNLSAPYTALFIQIAMSLIIATLFIVFNIDEKILNHPRSKSITLRMSQAKHNFERIKKSPQRAPSSMWDIADNTLKYVFYIASSGEALVHRSLAACAILVVLLAMMLGGVNG